VRVLIDYRPALRERSGVGEYAHVLAVALLKSRGARRGDGDALDLTLFSSSWKDRLVRAADLADASIVDRRVPVRILNFAWHRLQWPPIEMLAERRFDVVQSLHPLLLPTRHAAQVVTVHDLNFLLHPERTRAEIRRDYPDLVRAHARQADHVIAVSRFTASQIERLLEVPADRISVCPPSAPAWAPRAEGAPKDGYVLFFGTLEPRKNVGTLLDAYERLAARVTQVPPLVLAGRATAQSAPWLERISRPPLAGLVRHVGYVNPAERRALYEGARMLVQPSFEEGFGLPVLEAMTIGVPVVAADRGALPEVLGDAGTLVDAEDAEGFAQAIERLIDDPASALAATARGLARARSFTWEQTAATTLAAYEAAIAHRAAARGAA
jgi:glycosyltransferase involved in cell wall biosynthesis